MQVMANSKSPHKVISCRYRGYEIICRVYVNYKDSGRVFYAATAGADIWDKGWYWSRGIPSVIHQIDAKLDKYQRIWDQEKLRINQAD